MTGEEAKEILGLAGKGREIGNVRLIMHIAICMANDVGAPRLEPISRSSILVEPGTSGDRATPPLGDSESFNSVGKDPKEGKKVLWIAFMFVLNHTTTAEWILKSPKAKENIFQTKEKKIQKIPKT